MKVIVLFFFLNLSIVDNQ